LARHFWNLARLKRVTTRWINFTNILRASFLNESCAFIFLHLHFKFAVFWHKNFGAKTTLKMKTKLTPSLRAAGWRQRATVVSSLREVWLYCITPFLLDYNLTAIVAWKSWRYVFKAKMRVFYSKNKRP
jgi:hypothetical protein